MKKALFTLLFSCFYIFTFAQTLVPYLENNKYGFCDLDANVVVLPKYDEVEFFDTCGFANVRKSMMWSIIDKKGVEYLPFLSSKKYEVKPMVNCMKYDWENRRKKQPLVKHLFMAFNDYNTFWLINSLKKCNQSSFLQGYNANQHDNPSYYAFDDNSREPNFARNFLLLIDKDTLQSAIDTLGNTLFNKVKNIKIHNTRFLSYEKNDTTILYNYKTKKETHLPYRAIQKTMNDSCFFVVNKQPHRLYDEPTLSFYKKNDTIKIINQNNQVLFADILHSIKAISPIHYIATQNDSISFLLKVKNSKIDKIIFKEIYQTRNNKLIAKSINNKAQIIDYEGNIIFNSNYSEISESYGYRHLDYFTFKDGAESGILDSNYKEEFRFVGEIEEKTTIDGFYTFYMNEQVGLIDINGKIILPAQYAEIDAFNEKFFKVRVGSRNRSEGKNIGLFSKEGKEIIPPLFSEIYTSEYKGKTYFYADLNHYSKCYDENGIQIANSSIKYSHYISESPIRIESNHIDSSTIYDRFGNLLEKVDYPIFSEKIIIRSDSSIFYLISRNKDKKSPWKSEYTILDENGKSICAENQSISNSIFPQYFIHGLFPLRENNQEAVINHKKKIIIPLENQHITEINEQYIVLEKQKKYYFFTREGKPINTEGYDDLGIGYSSKGLRSVGINIPNKTFSVKKHDYYTKKDTIITLNHKNYGFIDEYGKLVIPMIYNSCPDIDGNFIAVSQGLDDGGKTSFVLDKLGNIVLKTKYDNLRIVFAESKNKEVLLEAKKGEKAGLINLKGKIILAPKYESIGQHWKNVLFRVDNEEGILINRKGEFIGSLKYNGLQMYVNYSPTTVYKDKIYILREENKTSLINLKGEIVKTFDTNQTRYLFERGSGVQMIYQNEKDNPKYPYRELLEVKKDNQTWYFNLENLKEYKKS